LHDTDLLTEVTNEDILSVVAENVPLLSRVPVKDHDPYAIPDQSFSLGVWQTGHRAVPASPVKSVHHFCVLPDGLQLPVPYRGVWQRYHRDVLSHHRDLSSQVSDLTLWNRLKTSSALQSRE